MECIPYVCVCDNKGYTYQTVVFWKKVCSYQNICVWCSLYNQQLISNKKVCPHHDVMHMIELIKQNVDGLHQMIIHIKSIKLIYFKGMSMSICVSIL